MPDFNEQPFPSLPRSALAPLAACVLGILFSAGHAAAAEVEFLPSPAPANSHLSRVTSDEQGRIFLSWVTESDAGAALAYAQLSEDTWSTPETIARGADWFVNWADFPVLSVHRGNKVAHWLEMSDEGAYDYDVVARFFDGQRQQWSDPRVLNTDGISAEHGFVSMLPVDKGQIMVTWLDGRRTRDTPEPGPMTLRAAFFDASGTRQDEWELDARVCDCCQTSSAMTDAGPVVVYRDRSAIDVRDTAIVRYVDDSWTRPGTVFDDDWQVMGCPVNGPSVSASDKLLAVAWFTARDQRPRVQLAISRDAGGSFSAPVPVAEINTSGRIDTALLASGDIVVSWVEVDQADATVMLSRFGSDGILIDTVEVAPVSASRRSGFPGIEATGDTVYVTWTDLADGPTVRVARVVF